MPGSEDTRNVMNFLEEYSGNTLRSAEALSIILDALAGQGAYGLMNELIFSGKSFYNLHLSLNHNLTNIEHRKFLEAEFAKSYREMIELLEQVLRYASEPKEREKLEQITKFENPLLTLDLAHDLSILKDLQALLKSKRK